MVDLREEVIKELFGVNVLNTLKAEANARTNELRPLGLSAWNAHYVKELHALKHDFFVTHSAALIEGAAS